MADPFHTILKTNPIKLISPPAAPQTLNGSKSVFAKGIGPITTLLGPSDGDVPQTLYNHFDVWL